jgi:hypothetical protein
MTECECGLGNCSTCFDAYRDQCHDLLIQVRDLKLTNDVYEREALRKELAAEKEAHADLQAAVSDSLRLADFLNEAAEGGAGYYPHWGERVLQAVEPIRDAKAFRSRTLSHNDILLEANSEFLVERDQARKWAKAWKRAASRKRKLERQADVAGLELERERDAAIAALKEIQNTTEAPEAQLDEHSE